MPAFSLPTNHPPGAGIASSPSSIPSSPTFSLYRQIISHSLSNHLYQNATFYASQLYSEYPNPESLHLYANAMFQAREYPQTHALLENYKALWYESFLNHVLPAKKKEATRKSQHPANSQQSTTAAAAATVPGGTTSTTAANNPANLTSLNSSFSPHELDLKYLVKLFLLYAVTCIELHKFQNAEEILQILWNKITEVRDSSSSGMKETGGADTSSNNNNKQPTIDLNAVLLQVVDRSVVAYYLGLCCLHVAHRAEKAASYFIEAANAGMWCAIEQLCQLGYNEWSMQQLVTKCTSEHCVAMWEENLQRQHEWEAEQHIAEPQSPSTTADDENEMKDDTAPSSNRKSASSTGTPRMNVTNQQNSGGVHNHDAMPPSSLTKTPSTTSSLRDADKAPKFERENPKKKSLSSRISLASSTASSLHKHLAFNTPSPHMAGKDASYGIISPPPSAHHVSFKTPSSGRRSSRRNSSDGGSIQSHEWVTPSPNRIDHHTGPPPIAAQGGGISGGSGAAHRRFYSGTGSRRASSVHSSTSPNTLLNQSNIANRLFVSASITPQPPQSIFMTPKSSTSSHHTQSEQSSQRHQLAPDDSSSTNAIHQFVRFISLLARAYQLFSLFKCKQSLSKFQQLTPKQQSTAWIMGKVARCYFEMEDYERAFQEFMRLTQTHPYQLQDLEYFSTTLWHLKREKELSFLAMRMSKVSKFAPQTLITIGNCFSLQKDHEKALQFFERASQVDPHVAYAHTLAGHEHLENDDTDDAMFCYREALRIDNRHYNAWYGLGTVYHRQEKHDKAKQHFEIALRIKPQSSVMRCYLGMTLKDSKALNEALEEFNKALQIMPNNPMTKFKRAEVFIELRDFETARDELEELKKLVPREAYLYCTLGDVYSQLRDEKSKKLAADHYQSALQLGYKDHGAIKEKISMLFDSGSEMDSMDE